MMLSVGSGGPAARLCSWSNRPALLHSQLGDPRPVFVEMTYLPALLIDQVTTGKNGFRDIGVHFWIGVLSDSVRRLLWRNAIWVVDLRSMRRWDRPVQQRVAGSVHPTVQPAAHFGENGLRGGVSGEIVVFVGIENQIV